MIRTIFGSNQNGGVNFASLNNSPFVYYYKEGANKGLIDNVVRAICIDKEGKIWVGSDSKGITIVDTQEHKVSFEYVKSDKIGKS